MWQVIRVISSFILAATMVLLGSIVSIELVPESFIIVGILMGLFLLSAKLFNISEYKLRSIQK